jgi:hypothetical protein
MSRRRGAGDGQCMRANLPADTPNLWQRCRRIAHSASPNKTEVRVADPVFGMVSPVWVIYGSRPGGLSVPARPGQVMPAA